MRKQKILKKRDFSLSDMPEMKLKSKKNVSSYSATSKIKNKSYISKALWQCLVENDVDAFKEILRAHLEFSNKDDIAEKAGIPKRTLFRMLSPEGNPTLENVSKIIHQLCA